MISSYLKIFPLTAQPGQCLVYSTAKASLAILPEALVEELQGGNCPAEFLKDMVALGFWVADPQAEQHEVFALQQELASLSTTLSVSVVVNLHCNFACPYCFEGTLKARRYMDDATASQLILFLKEQYQPHHQSLYLAFYGGEPLLSVGRICEITKAMHCHVTALGGEFTFSLVTNGSLLSRATVEKMLPYGLDGAKVTLDGPPQFHNQTRPFKGGGKSFQLIIDNLKSCWDLLPISIGGNYSKDNFKAFPQLLDILAQEGLGPDRLAKVKFDPVMDVTSEFANAEHFSGCSSINEPWVSESAIFLREEILQRGYTTPTLAPARCAVTIPDNYVIHVDGDIYKCIVLMGQSQFVAGTIYDGFYDYSEAYNIENWQQETECHSCSYLPLCYGGCRYFKLQRHGDMGVDCKKKMLNATLEPFLLQDARYRYGLTL